MRFHKISTSGPSSYMADAGTLGSFLIELDISRPVVGRWVLNGDDGEISAHRTLKAAEAAAEAAAEVLADRAYIAEVAEKSAAAAVVEEEDGSADVTTARLPEVHAGELALPNGSRVRLLGWSNEVTVVSSSASSASIINSRGERVVTPLDQITEIIPTAEWERVEAIVDALASEAGAARLRAQRDARRRGETEELLPPLDLKTPAEQEEAHRPVAALAAALAESPERAALRALEDARRETLRARLDIGDTVRVASYGRPLYLGVVSDLAGTHGVEVMIPDSGHKLIISVNEIVEILPAPKRDESALTALRSRVDIGDTVLLSRHDDRSNVVAEVTAHIGRDELEVRLASSLRTAWCKLTDVVDILKTARPAPAYVEPEIIDAEILSYDGIEEGKKIGLGILDFHRDGTAEGDWARRQILDLIREGITDYDAAPDYVMETPLSALHDDITRREATISRLVEAIEGQAERVNEGDHILAALQSNRRRVERLRAAIGGISFTRSINRTALSQHIFKALSPKDRKDFTVELREGARAGKVLLRKGRVAIDFTVSGVAR